jgi:DNA modification methylase
MANIKWPADRPERRKIDSLIPYARNSRTHSDEQIAQIAASIKEWGFTNPVLIEPDGGIIAGHGRVLAAQRLNLDEVPCIIAEGWTDAQKRAYVIADNKLALNAGWDNELLAVEFGELAEIGFDVDLTGFTPEEIAALLPEQVEEGLTDEDAVPEIPEEPVTKLGDIWMLGKHRLMCGDSTSINAVDKLMAGASAALLHADPPYGMGKESDGVANDNLYAEKLDAFQMEWWATFRTFLDNNASVYIWGNAPELWRLWYCGGLVNSERLTFRNQIVWKKNTAQGIGTAKYRSYATSTEHCLFFMIGQQEASKDSDDFSEAWLPVLEYLVEQRNIMEWSSSDVCQILGKSTATHYFSKSQFQIPHQEAYEILQKKAQGKAFAKSYKQLESEFNESRAFFDNTHDLMMDVWEFGSVANKERHGHATPKPVAMMERVMNSSLPKGGLCVEPFGGSGSTLMGAEKTGRMCYTMELQPKYCDVIVKRWQDFTGKQATLEATGQTFDEVASETRPQTEAA